VNTPNRSGYCKRCSPIHRCRRCERIHAPEVPCSPAALASQQRKKESRRSSKRASYYAKSATEPLALQQERLANIERYQKLALNHLPLFL
jgi:hypothetical protein